MIGVDRAVLGRQIAYMPEGGEDLIAPPEIFVDGLRLRRRFNDDDFHAARLLRGLVDEPKGLRDWFVKRAEHGDVGWGSQIGFDSNSARPVRRGGSDVDDPEPENADQDQVDRHDVVE